MPGGNKHQHSGPPGYLQPTYGRLVGSCTEEVLVNAVCQGEVKGRQLGGKCWKEETKWSKLSVLQMLLSD